MKAMVGEQIGTNLGVRGFAGVSSATLREQAAGAAIERQLDEIQRTFGVRWEW